MPMENIHFIVSFCWIVSYRKFSLEVKKKPPKQSLNTIVKDHILHMISQNSVHSFIR